MVTSKGHNAHAIKMVSREIKLTGYTRVFLKTDQEPAITGVAEAVRRERPESQDMQVRQEVEGRVFWGGVSLHLFNSALKCCSTDIMRYLS